MSRVVVGVVCPLFLTGPLTIECSRLWLLLRCIKLWRACVLRPPKPKPRPNLPDVFPMPSKFFDELRDYDLKVLAPDGAMSVARGLQPIAVDYGAQYSGDVDVDAAIKGTMRKRVTLAALCMCGAAEREKSSKAFLLGWIDQYKTRDLKHQIQLSGTVVEAVPQGISAFFRNTQLIVAAPRDFTRCLFFRMFEIPKQEMGKHHPPQGFDFTPCYQRLSDQAHQLLRLFEGTFAHG